MTPPEFSQNFTRGDILSLSQRYRNNLINSISGFKSANLIGTIDQKGIANLGLFSSVTHIGSNPPLLGFVLRPTTVPRHTYQNLKESGFYTINHVQEHIVESSHQSSAKYPESTDEFDACHLTKEWSGLHPAPYVAESNVQIGMSYEEEYHIRANDTLLIIGSIVELRIKGQVVAEDGFVDLAKAKTVTINGLDGYLTTNDLRRYRYARPGETLRRL